MRAPGGGGTQGTGNMFPFHSTPAHLKRIADQLFRFWLLFWIIPDIVPANISSRYLWNRGTGRFMFLDFGGAQIHYEPTSQKS